MFTSNPDGSGLYVLDPYGDTSHFIWRDPQYVLAWARHPMRDLRFYLYGIDRSRLRLWGGRDDRQRPLHLSSG